MAKKKILIVDDEPSIGRFLKFALEKSTLYDVSYESDSSKAVAVVRSSKPDLLLLDMNMPQTSGAEIAATIMADPSLAKMPIIFLTGNVTEEEAESGLTIDGLPAVGKPINLERLLQRIEKSLQ